MKTVSKDQLISGLIAQTDAHLNEAVNAFQVLTNEQLLAPAADGGWSAAQCMEHLNRYGCYYLPEIKKALLRAQGRPVRGDFSSSWLGRYFTAMMQPDSGRKKIKAFKDYIPERRLDARAVISAFTQQLELMSLYLHEARTIDIGSVRIPISLTRMIRLKLGDVLQFVVAHNERHVRQIRNVLREKN